MSYLFNSWPHRLYDKRWKEVAGFLKELTDKHLQLLCLTFRAKAFLSGGDPNGNDFKDTDGDEEFHGLQKFEPFAIEATLRNGFWLRYGHVPFVADERVT